MTGETPNRPLVAPLDRTARPELDTLFSTVEQTNGYLPSSLLTMAHMPGLTEAFAGLARAVLGPGRIEPQLKALVSLVASTASGCRYCQAHTSTTASKAGAADPKVTDVWLFETSPHFDERERAALRLARDAAQVPNAVPGSSRDTLAGHFDDAEITELVAVIALFGFLNRWNDTMATPLEAHPVARAEALLGAAGWHPGKHG